jgi:DNA modification methylase
MDTAKITIENVDCLIGLDKLSKNGTSIDLTFTSPPYFNVKDYSTWKTYEEYIDFISKVFTSILSITKEGRLCCINVSNILVPRSSRSSESQRIPLAFHIVSLMEKIGWKFLEDIVWVKPSGAAKNRNGGFFQHRQPVAYKPNVINEYIFVFQKPSKFLIDKIVRDYSIERSFQSKIVDDKYEKTNIWEINPETKVKHPAPFPLKLAENIIRYYSYIDDTILDPFVGSGTTVVMSHKLNRKFIGFEIHQKYIDIAISRIEETIPEKLISLDFDKSQYDSENKKTIIQKLLKQSKSYLSFILEKYVINKNNENSKTKYAELIHKFFWENT